MRSDTKNGNLKRVLFTEEQTRKLEQNPNVHHVTEAAITYTPAFKLEALKAYSRGRHLPRSSYVLASTWTLLAIRSPRTALKRWRETFERYGEDALATERVVRVARDASQPVNCQQKMN